MANDSHPYIPSVELRRKLGWDGGHDLMAEQIKAEYGLQMPRDCELIRQLTLTRIQQGQRVDADPGISWSPEAGWIVAEPGDGQ